MLIYNALRKIEVQ